MIVRRALPIAALALTLVFAAPAQVRRPLPQKEALDLFSRTVELMEAASVVSPELSRAGAPVIENARQTIVTMRSLSPMHAGLTNTFLTNARVFSTLADAVPKPDPFPEQAARQLAELRDNLTRIDSHFRALLEQKEAQIANSDWANLKRYSESNALVQPPAAARPRVVFMGDSITDFWRLNEYFGDRDFINRGISGQITLQMLGRMKADVIDLKPAAMIVLAGTNDIARGVPLAAIQNNLSMIADVAQAHGIKPLFSSVLPIHDYNKGSNPAFEMSRRRPPAMIRELNNWLQSFCKARGYTYVDYFAPMVDESGFLKKDLANDGLHPNATGYRVMAPVALQAIDRVLAGAQKTKKR